MGTYYDRLTKVSDLSYDDSDEDARYQEATELIARCRELAASFRAEPGMSGETATAALAWLSEYEKTLQTKATELETMYSRQKLARQAMVTAKQQHATLSPQLVSSYEASYLIHSGPFTLANGTEVSGATYLNQLRHQRDLERERKAKTILDAMDEAVSEQRNRITEPLPVEESPVPSGSGGGGGAPRVPSSSGGGHRPSGPGYAVITPSPSIPVPSITPGPSDPGTPPVSDDPPITYTPITVPNGPVVGTYTPPSVLDATDPAWSPTYRPPGVPAADVGAIVGGVIGVGASAVAAKALGAGMTGSAALAFQTAAGSGSAVGLTGYNPAAGAVRAPGGGMLAGPASRAAAAEAGAANSANAGRAGQSGTRAGGLVSRSGAANGRGSGAKSGADGRNGAATDSRKDKRKRREQTTLVGYDVDRLEDDAAPVEVDHPAMAAGESAQLSPLESTDDGERW